MNKKELTKILEKSVNLKKEEIESLIEIPQKPELGDFAFPCFKLASILKKNPLEIAKGLEKEIKPQKGIIKVQAQGPYLNFFLDRKTEAQELFEKVDKNYGKENIGKNKRIVIDFSSPNIGKPMHVGHIRSTIIGDCLIRTYDYLGYETIGINFLGDTGLHIGKLIVAWELWLDKKALIKDPIAELLRLYVKFCENEKSQIQEGTDEESDDAANYENNEWTKKAKEKLKLIELGDKETHKIWEEIKIASGKGFDRVYKILNVKFTETTGPSKFGEIGKEIIFNAEKKGLAKIEKSGAVYVEFPSEKLPKKYILRSNGTASYITYDIGAAVERAKKYKFDKMIYVTDYRQGGHFEQLFSILKIFGYDFSEKLEHIGHGTVNFEKEIFATREGKVILLEDVLKKTIQKAKEEIEKRKTNGNPEKVAVAAVKYIILRNEPVKDVEFSWDAALNFEGDSGPYLQYSYARASSIINKAKKTKNKIEIPNRIEPSEIALIKKIKDFPQIAKQVSEKLNPQLMANYAFQLSQIFNEFYTNCKVLESENEAFRIKLVDCFRITLKNALYLLGIEVMEEM
jgi:arginyl-tRNA synthetase